MKKDYKKPNTTIINVDVTAMMATSPGGGNTVDVPGTGGEGNEEENEFARANQFDELW